MEYIFLENLKTDKENLNTIAKIFTRFRSCSQVVLSDIAHLKKHYTDLDFDSLDQEKTYYITFKSGGRGSKGINTIHELDIIHWSKFINNDCEMNNLDDFSKVNNVFNLKEQWFIFKF
jgi:hypothetical protein